MEVVLRLLLLDRRSEYRGLDKEVVSIIYYEFRVVIDTGSNIFYFTVRNIILFAYLY